MKKAVFKNFAILTAEFIQSGKIRGKKENLRKVGENQGKKGKIRELFPWSGEIVFSRLTQGIF